MDNLYELPVNGAKFTTYCGGNLGGDHESCAEVAPIPGAADGFVMRDNKPGGAGGNLRFTGSELDSFALRWVKDRGLTV
ncbi:DUF397 domain-containing protein [Micromonospora sp. CA-263727]|uniref:DUF397 domain-containing protein n=1 Tax=Micromonospora sp. CA-263727 TaxID=3239967 RepID=UPI003D8F390E